MINPAQGDSGVRAQEIAVAYLAAEVAPFAKVGGLGDVAGSLPPALVQRGVRIVVLMPRYGSIDLDAIDAELIADDLVVHAAGRDERFRTFRAHLKHGVSVLLLDHRDLFGQPQVYVDARDRERFTFFGTAVSGMLAAAGVTANVFHANDWHTAPALLEPGNYARVFTIHNMAHQGITDIDYAQYLGLPTAPLLAAERGGRYPGRINLMARAIVNSDLVTTVSPQYAREITTPAFGEGLENLLRMRIEDLVGILNGIDVDVYDPVHDPLVPFNFSPAALGGKAKDKSALENEVGLHLQPGEPLIGIVSRLDDQKGLDLVIAGMERILGTGVGVVVLGTGAPVYHAALQRLAESHPDRLAVRLQFDAGLAQRIYAGSDMFLMPSRFEPCGLGQMIAMRYGAVPIVRATGGLADTVYERTREQNGFTFEEYSVDALVDAVGRAVESFRDRQKWLSIVAKGMQHDFSWDNAAAQYMATYRRALDRRLVRTAGSQR